MRIGFLSEVPEFMPYTLDIYLPEWHLAIEIDGDGHYPKKDERRDNYLRDEYGIITMRIKAKGAWGDKNRLKKSITEFIEAFADDSAARMETWKITHSGA